MVWSVVMVLQSAPCTGEDVAGVSVSVSVSVSFFLSLLRCVPNKERFPIPFRPL